jgi:hypothetical protein
MARFYLLAFLLLLALTAVAMISVLSAERGDVRTFPRGVWVVMILLLPLFGPVLYFAFGRPRRGEGGGLSSGLPEPPKTRPIAPDDDPDFLRRLGRGRSAPGPTLPPAADTRAGDAPTSGDANDNSRSAKNPPPAEDRTPDGPDEGRTRGDARTKDDQPPSDSNH